MSNKKKFFGAQLPVLVMMVFLVLAGSTGAFAAEAYFADSSNTKLTEVRIGLGLTQTIRVIGQVPTGKLVKAFKMEILYDNAIVEIANIKYLNGFDGAYLDDKAGKITINGFNVLGLSGNAALFEITLKGKAVGSGFNNVSIGGVINFGASATDEFIPTSLIPINVAVVAEKIYFKDSNNVVVVNKTMEVGSREMFTVYADIPANKTLKAFRVDVFFNPAVVSISNLQLNNPFSGAVNLENGKIAAGGFNTTGILGRSSVGLFSFFATALATGNANFTIEVENFGESSTDEFLPAPQNPNVNVIAATTTTTIWTEETTTTTVPGVTTTTTVPGATTTTTVPGATTTTVPGITTTTVPGVTTTVPGVTTTTTSVVTTTTIPATKPPTLTSPLENAINQLLTVVLQLTGYDPTVHKAVVWEVKDASGKVIFTTKTSSANIPIPDMVLSPNQDYTWRAKFELNDGTQTDWSPSRIFKTITQDPLDKTANGIPDSQEVKDATVDLDKNGVPDINQPNTKIAVNDVGKPVKVLVTGSGIVSDIAALKLGLAANDTTMPLGTVAFKALVSNPGGEADIKIYLSEAAGKGAVWADGATGQKVGYEATISEDGKAIIIKIKDGGPYDKDGIANGIIVISPAGVKFITPEGTVSHDNCFISTILK